MRFAIRVLGPLEVTDGGTPIAITRPQVREVIAVLAAAAGQAVTGDLLAYALWPDAAPKSPKSALHNRIFRARAVFGDEGTEVIVSDGESYRLSLDRCGIDLRDWFDATDEARRATIAQRPLEGVERFAYARSLWRGEPFGSVAESEHLDRERRRLEQALTDVELDEAQALMEARRPGEAARLLAAILGREPLREDVAVAAMAALRDAGRAGEALRVASGLREQLRLEYGASPSKTFDDLELSLLGGSAGGPRPRRTASRSSIWRPALLDAAVSGAVAALSADAARAIVVRSPPGYGLSTFLTRLAHEIGHQAPLARLHHLHHRPGMDHSLRQELALTVPGDADDEQREQTLALDQIAGTAGERELCLVVDDALELDAWSRALLDMLVTGPLPRGMSLVAGLHLSDDDDHRWLAAPGPVLALDRLDQRDIEGMLGENDAALSAGDRHRTARKILEWCRGDPRWSGEAVRSVALHGPGAPLPVPRPAADQIADRLHELDAATIELLRAAAALGESIDGILVSALTGHPVDEVVGRLGLASSRGLVVRASRPGWWAFADRLTHEIVASDLGGIAAQELHASAGRWLLDHKADPMRAARHLVEAVPLIDDDTAAEAARTAGRLLVGEARYDEAAFLFSKAAELAPTLRDGDPDRVAWAGALERIGDHDRADEIYDDVITRAEADLDLLATVALGGAGHSSRIGGQVARRRRLGLAHRRLDPAHRHADDVTAELGLELLIGGLPIDPALWDELRRVADDPRSPARHLALRVVLVVTELRSGASIEQAQLLADLALAAIDARQDAYAGASLAVACHLASVCGDWHVADAWIDELEVFGARSGEPRSRWQSLAYRAAIAEARGPEGAADEIAEQAREVGLQLGIADAHDTYRLHLLGRALRSGALAFAAPGLRDVAGRYHFPVWFALRGLAELDAGDEREAKAMLDQTRDALSGGPDTFRPPAIALGCLLAARLDDVERVPELAEELDRRAGRMVFLGYGGPFLGPADWFRAVAADASGHTEQASRLVDEAIDGCRRAGAESWQPRLLDAPTGPPPA